MENENLGSKKMNNKQNEKDNLLSIDKINHLESVLEPEMEVDKDGVRKIVQRARHTNHVDENQEASTDKKLSTTPSNASENIGKVMVENTDKNFDITKKRYSNSSP